MTTSTAAPREMELELSLSEREARCLRGHEGRVISGGLPRPKASRTEGGGGYSQKGVRHVLRFGALVGFVTGRKR
jgi:hypothetical protein